MALLIALSIIGIGLVTAAIVLAVRESEKARHREIAMLEAQHAALERIAVALERLPRELP